MALRTMNFTDLRARFDGFELLSGMKIEATELIRHPHRPLRLNRLRKNAIKKQKKLPSGAEARSMHAVYVGAKAPTS
jgi:hypothetical protein